MIDKSPSALRRELALTRGRLAAAEAALAAVAERDHELRNLVAGLAGAAAVLGAANPTDSRILLVAAHAELARLQQMLEVAPPDGPPSTAVAAVLRDLVAVHRAGGMAVRVAVTGDPVAAVDRRSLAQIVANLLVNCARHARGAAVEVRAREVRRRVRVEVADDGPGMADVLGADVPGADVPGACVPGARAGGTGLGLAITARVLRAHGGTLAVRSSGRGLTVVVELPAAEPAIRSIAG